MRSMSKFKLQLILLRHLIGTTPTLSYRESCICDTTSMAHLNSGTLMSLHPIQRRSLILTNMLMINATGTSHRLKRCNLMKKLPRNSTSRWHAPRVLTNRTKIISKLKKELPDGASKNTNSSWRTWFWGRSLTPTPERSTSTLWDSKLEIKSRGFPLIAHGFPT